MVTPRVLVLRAPGTNCDVETAYAFEQCGARAERVHLFRLLEQPRQLQDFQILCIPGGFSYGDDGGAGVVFGSQLRGHLAEVLREYLQSDRLMLGICNGFQVLMRAGILPDGSANWPPVEGEPRVATLTWNDNGKYTARWVHLRTAGSHSVFLRGMDELDLPVAHAEGRIAVRDAGVIDAWERRGQIALCYAPAEARDTAATTTNASAVAAGSAAANAGAAVATVERPAALSADILPYPINPNGSAANIAGLCDATGRVLGLMPHPERFVHATQHPQWTRRAWTGETGDGLQIFQNAVDYFR